MKTKLIFALMLSLAFSQCTSTREWIASDLLGVSVAPSSGSSGFSSDPLTASGPILVEEPIQPSYTYRITPAQRAEVMRKIKAAGLDHLHDGGIIYVPVTPANTQTTASRGRHYVPYDEVGNPSRVVVLGN